MGLVYGQVDSKLETLLIPKITNSVMSGLAQTAKVFSAPNLNFKPVAEMSGEFTMSSDISASANLARTTPFDMKLGFSRSKKLHHSKDGGWYLNIPLRHKTYGKNKMPRNVYDEARKLANGESLSVNAPAGQSWTGYQHKNNQYDGLRRMVNRTYGHYYTFRRVSNNSDPLSWWHPGLPQKTAQPVDSAKRQKAIEEFAIAAVQSALRK